MSETVVAALTSEESLIERFARLEVATRRALRVAREAQVAVQEIDRLASDLEADLWGSVHPERVIRISERADEIERER